MAETVERGRSRSPGPLERRRANLMATAAGKTVSDLKKSIRAKDETAKIFKKLDQDKSQSVEIEEIAVFIHKNDELWRQIASKLKQPKEVARDAATRVAMELASGKVGKEALESELTKEQFHAFRKKYILDEEGKEEFIQRSIFAAFDTDHSNELDQEELGKFLDTIYASRQNRGRESLVAKDDLQKLIMERTDEEALSFSKINDFLKPTVSQTTKALEKYAEIAKEEDAKEWGKAEGGEDDEYVDVPGRNTNPLSKSTSKSTLEETLEFTLVLSDPSKQKPKEDGDVCSWLERKLTGNPDAKGYCHDGKRCVIS